MSLSGTFNFGLIQSGSTSSSSLASGSVGSGSVMVSSGFTGFSSLASGAVPFSSLASGAVPFSFLASGVVRSGSLFGMAEIREKEIRASVPLCDETPAQIVADWLQDNLRDDDAAFMRSRMSGG